MRRRAKDIKYTGDPALLPIQNNELSFLVRILYRITSYLNEAVGIFKKKNLMFYLKAQFSTLQYSEDLQDYWNRNDFVGKLTHRLLEPPVSIRTFEKSHGTSRLRENYLGARLNLRWIASYKTIAIIFLSLLFGQLLYGIPVFGFFLLILFKFFSIFLFAAYDLLVHI